jgi:hypothetical protein
MCTSCLDLDSAMEIGVVSCQLFSGESNLLDARTDGPDEVLCLEQENVCLFWLYVAVLNFL